MDSGMQQSIKLGVMERMGKEKFLHFGKIKVDRDFFHKKIKKNILKKSGDFCAKLGENPDIEVVNGKIVFTGSTNGPFKGKSFITSLDIEDYIDK